MEESKKKLDPQGSIQLDKYHTWQYRKYPNLLLAGNGTGKSRVLMGYHKLLAETEEESYICDGKNDELYELCKDYLNLQMLNPMQWQSMKQFERLKIMEYR